MGTFIKKILKRKMKTGIELIAEERQEQIEKHGRSVFYDRSVNNDRQLSIAAMRLIGDRKDYPCPAGWDKELWERMLKKSNIKRHIIAGALIAAEIDRLQVIG
jgi:hypothetical protein